MLSCSLFDMSFNAFILYLWHGIQCFLTPSLTRDLMLSYSIFDMPFNAFILSLPDHAEYQCKKITLGTLSTWISETFVRLCNQRELLDNQCVNITGWKKKIWHFIHVQKYENSRREMYYGIRKEFSNRCWHLVFSVYLCMHTQSAPWIFRCPRTRQHDLNIWFILSMNLLWYLMIDHTMSTSLTIAV